MAFGVEVAACAEPATVPDARGVYVVTPFALDIPGLDVGARAVDDEEWGTYVVTPPEVVVPPGEEPLPVREFDDDEDRGV